MEKFVIVYIYIYVFTVYIYDGGGIATNNSMGSILTF